MFRRSLVKLAATAVKQTTGITGIPVVPNAREVLISLYRRTIDIAEQYGTEGKNYNQAVINISKDRLSVLEKEESIPVIEDIIGVGQIEQLIQHAEEELELMDLMNNEFHPWAVNPAVVQNFNETHSPAFGDDLPGGNIVLYPTKPGFPDLTFPFEFYPGWPHVPPPKSVAEFKAMVASAEGNGTASGGEDGAPAAPAAAEKK